MSSNNKTSTSSPPPPSPDSSSPPPPPSKDSSPPPPPPNDNSPPPPSSSKFPPPPPRDNSSPPPPGKNNSRSPPPPPPKDQSPSPSKDRSPPFPPPPPRSPSSKKNSPPPPLSHRSSPSSKSNNSSSASTAEEAIIGGAVAGGALFIIAVIILFVCCKKKTKRHDQKHYSTDSSASGGGNNYYNYNSGQQGQWNQSAEYTVRISPPPTSHSSGGWTAIPPPPMMSSGEMSSADFSGGRGPPLPPPHPTLALGFTQSTFTYDDLAAATGGFAKNNLLGQGGFGYVHKGVLPNGKEIAVKSLKNGSGQGEREFQAEVEIISRVHHRHLVSLVGYCIADAQRMLVYEFVPNNSLEFHLHGKGQPVMDLPTRLKIALGAAKGFAYLHEDCHPRIIHRDIKAANILLDYKYEAKVADFGLAKLYNDNYTHVSTRIMGTFGFDYNQTNYIVFGPEYAASGKLTEKSDVYSYGVVLLELITGRRPIEVNSEDDSLVDWARPIIDSVTENGDCGELADPRLESSYNRHDMLRMVACAAACIRHSARKRPRMSQVVRALEGDVSLEDLTEAVKTGNQLGWSSQELEIHEEYDKSEEFPNRRSNSRMSVGD
ncbi:Non-specific serine/threonine protein kinase [Bertholletia excelsa]